MIDGRISYNVPLFARQISTTSRIQTQKITDSAIEIQTFSSYSNYWVKYQSCICVCAFIFYTIIVITVGVITVYLTSLKTTSRPCQLNFRRSAKVFNEYDSRPHDIATGDFNHDGHLDLVVANAGTDNIGVFINDHNGTFHPQVTFPTGTASRPYSLAVGHLDNDTHLDVVVANFDMNSIGVLLGNGNGTFATPLYTSLGSSRPLSLALADFNNDTALDVVVANDATFTIAVLLGDNHGFFRIASVYAMGYDSMPCSVTVADLNQDHQLDIVAVNYGTSELVILLADGNGSFVLYKYWTDSASHPSSLTTTHLNNDDLLDIVIAYSDTSSMGIFLGVRNGTFINHKTYPLDVGSRPQFISVGDFNNDTHSNIVVLDSQHDNLLILKVDDNGNFSIITRHSTGYNSNPSSAVIDDFDNDHQLDIAINNNGSNNVLLLTSYMIYFFTNRAAYSGKNTLRPNSMDISDLNADNYLDIVLSDDDTGDVAIFLNNGNGTFKNEQIYNMGESTGLRSVLTGDVNNDHHLDIIVVLNNISSIEILLGYGNGSFFFGEALSIETGSFVYSMALSDMNNDDNLDIVIVDSNTYRVGLFLGFGNGIFTKMNMLFDGIVLDMFFVQISDINGDNNRDIIVASEGNYAGIIVLLGYGNGSFHDPLFTSTDGDVFSSFTTGDVDNDRRTDIIYISTFSTSIGVLLGREDGTFEIVNKYFDPLGFGLRSVALGYYNNDAFLDIAVTLILHFSINIYLGKGNGSFETPFTLFTEEGSLPFFVIFADVDNDSQQDIVIGDVGENPVRIFYIHSTIDFANQTSCLTGSSPHPVSVSIADLNNDGKSDLVVANSGTDHIELLMNYNRDSFIDKMTFSTGLGSHPQSVTIADFNRDHLLDIAVANTWDGSINVFLGLGNESFSTRYVYSTGTGSAPYSIVSSDLNKDGRMDIVTVNKDVDIVHVFLAFDYVSFATQVIALPGLRSIPSSMVSGDFNNDHLVDIVIGNAATNDLVIYLGYGNGTFSEQISILTSEWFTPDLIAVGDFNNDSRLDLAIADSGMFCIGIYLGYGNGSFHLRTSYPTGTFYFPMSIATADLDKNGKLDLVVAVFTEDGGTDLWVFLGNGNGLFRKKLIYSVTYESLPSCVVVGDLNNDTNLDIVVADSEANKVYMLFGYGDGRFRNVTTLFTGKQSSQMSVALGKFNRDEFIDIVVADRQSRTISLFFGYGNGSFISQNTYSVDSNALLQSIIVSDVNNDAILDILVSDVQINSNIVIFYGFGDGNFTLPEIYSIGVNTYPEIFVTSDFNSDGKIDLATCNSNGNSITIFIQMGRKPFASSTEFTVGNQSQPNSAVIGDFNNDNIPDIAVTNSATNNIAILLGYGNGDFAHPFISLTGIDSLPSAINLGYFNTDQSLDIAVANAANDSVSLFLGHENGSFTMWTTYSTGLRSTPVALTAKDMNRDGYIDLIVANRGSNEVLVFVGTENGTFSEVKRYSLGYDTRPQSVAIDDIDNDGMLDIAVANDAAGYIEILLQTC